MWVMKIPTRGRKKEFGIEKRKTLSLKEINKTEEQKNKKEKRLIKNGKRDPKCLSQKLVRWKTMIRLIKQNKVGVKEESLDMGGNKTRLNRKEG